MEKIMSKTNDTKKIRELTEDHRPLADSELDAVSGGFPLYNLAELLGWGSSHPAKVTVPEIKLGVS
jgi:hypothetical protein